MESVYLAEIIFKAELSINNLMENLLLFPIQCFYFECNGTQVHKSKQLGEFLQIINNLNQSLLKQARIYYGIGYKPT